MRRRSEPASIRFPTLAGWLCSWATTYLVGLTEQQQHTTATAARNGAPYICAPKELQWPHLVNGPLATPDPADNLSHRALTSHQPVPPLWER